MEGSLLFLVLTVGIFQETLSHPYQYNVEEILDKLRGDGVDARKYENVFGYQLLDPVTSESVESEASPEDTELKSENVLKKLKVSNFVNNEVVEKHPWLKIKTTKPKDDSVESVELQTDRASRSKNNVTAPGPMKLLRKKVITIEDWGATDIDSIQMIDR